MVPSIRLIVNADDLGYSKSRDMGVCECIENGVVTSCSLLVNAENSHEAVKMIAQYLTDDKISLGLHINLSEGTPVHANHKTIIDERGFFHDKMGIRKKVANGELDSSEILRELQSQVEQFLSLVGRLPSHVDGHQHVHVLPGINEAVSTVCVQYGIQRIRLPAEQANEIKLPLPDFHASVVRNSEQSRTIFAQSHLRSPNFIGLTTMGSEMTINNVQLACEQYLQDTVSSELHQNPIDSLIIELMVHPGYTTDDLAGGCGLGADEFSRSMDRTHEQQFLLSSEFDMFLRKHNIELCTFFQV